MVNGISNSIQSYDFGVSRTAKSRTLNENKFLMETSKVNTITREVNTDEPLDYYNEFVKMYPDISFRLSDVEEGMKHMSEPYYGYNNHMNQVGSNFGEPDQISVEIDVAVIRRMMKDADYAKQVHRQMHDFQENFGSWKSTGLSGGDTNFYMILDVGERGLQASVLSCAHPIFTEEQSRALNAMYDTSDNKYLKMLAQRRDELEEDFMKMVAERQEDRLTYEQIREKWDREYRKME